MVEGGTHIGTVDASRAAVESEGIRETMVG